MCEAHVNDIIRKNFKVKKVTSSHSKGITEIIAEDEISEDLLRQEIAALGYKVISVKTEEYKKKWYQFFK